MDMVEGVNVSVTVQAALTATWFAVEHVAPVMAKSPAFAPERDGLREKVSDAVPVFVNVTVIGALVTPSVIGPNGKLAGRLTTGAGGGGGGGGAADWPEPPQAARVNTPAASATTPGMHRITRD